MRRIRLPRKLPTMQFPLHYEGAPPRRLFFPEWYITCVKPKDVKPKNYVRFHIPADMTRYDLKEYLKKVYDIPVASINLAPVGMMKYKCWNLMGGYEWKFMDPYKIAHVMLAEGQTFEFPEMLNDPESPTQIQELEKFEREQSANKLSFEQEAHSKQYLSNEWF